MKISFLIPAIVLYVVEIAYSNSLQVGTVLFSTTDLVKKCWTENDKSLLKARFIMQDVLPDPDCIDFSKPEASVVLLDYFHACYQIIGTSTYGRLQNLMYMALSDALGGYLRAYVLPFARRAYYAGQLQYSEAKKLFQLYDDIRLFLKTNGIGWAEPLKVCFKRVRAKPLTITGGSLEACAQLFMIEKEKLHCINAPKSSSKNQCCHSSSESKCSPDDCQQGDHCNKNKRTSFRNSSISGSTAHHCSSSDTFPPNFTKRSICSCKKYPQLDSKRIIIPLPVLDDCMSPHTIAVPFKKRPLRNLSSKSSAFILEYYYLAVVQCFIARGNTRMDIKNFNSQFHSWLVTQVFPHLGDEKWYPGFGGVLRVMETIRRFGAETMVKDTGLHDIQFMFSQGVSFDLSNDPLGKEKVPEIGEVDDCECSSKRHYIILVMLVSLIWLFIFCACGFFCQALRGRKASSVPSSREETQEETQKNAVDFQFLIKFFKKKDEAQKDEQAVHHTQVESEDRYGMWKNILQPDTPTWVEQQRREMPFAGDMGRRRKDMKRLVMTAQGDIASLGRISNLGTKEGSIVPECEVQLPRKDTQKSSGDKSDLHMLWKKRMGQVEKKSAHRVWEKSPRGLMRSKRNTMSTSGEEDSFRKQFSPSCSASTEDETKALRREKRSSTSCYSDSSRQANTSSINYSITEAQESTAESYTFGEDSGSNESHY